MPSLLHTPASLFGFGFLPFCSQIIKFNPQHKLLEKPLHIVLVRFSSGSAAEVFESKISQLPGQPEERLEYKARTYLHEARAGSYFSSGETLDCVKTMDV